MERVCNQCTTLSRADALSCCAHNNCPHKAEQPTHWSNKVIEHPDGYIAFDWDNFTEDETKAANDAGYFKPPIWPNTAPKEHTESKSSLERVWAKIEALLWPFYP